MLVKIAPDLSNEAIDEIARVSIDNGIDGIIAINTSLDRFNLKNLRIKTGNTLEQENGGLSGAPLEKRGLEVIRRLRNSTNSALPLIGVGGINSILYCIILLNASIEFSEINKIGTYMHHIKIVIKTQFLHYLPYKMSLSIANNKETQTRCKT